MNGILAIDTHPVQYRAPLYRYLQTTLNIPVTVLYQSDQGVASYWDEEFKEKFSWDTNLTEGYKPIFLSRLKGKTSGKTTLQILFKLIKKIIHYKPKVIFISGYANIFYQTALLASICLRYRIFFRAETNDRVIYRNRFKGWVRKKVLTWLYSHCEKLFYIGQNSLEHYQETGVLKEKLIFSPYFVDTTHFDLAEERYSLLRNEVRRKLRIDSQHFVILFSGKLSIKKRPDLLLEAFLKVSRHRDNLHLIYLGNGEIKNELEKKCREQAYDKVHFLNFLNQSQMSPYYTASNVLVLPSQYGETWGLVVNEAMHHGLPCIVSDIVGCAPDLIQKKITGDIFKTNSLESLITTLETAFGWITSDFVRSACQNKVGNYTLEKAALPLAVAYKNIVDNHA